MHGLEFDGTQNIEVPISSATTDIVIGDQPFFKDKEIVGLEVHVADNTSIAPQSGNAVIATAAAKAGNIILKTASGKEKFSNLPLSCLVPSLNNGILKKIKSVAIDWANSKLRFASGSTADTTTCLITVYYKDTI